MGYTIIALSGVCDVRTGVQNSTKIKHAIIYSQYLMHNTKESFIRKIVNEIK